MFGNGDKNFIKFLCVLCALVILTSSTLHASAASLALPTMGASLEWIADFFGLLANLHGANDPIGGRIGGIEDYGSGTLTSSESRVQAWFNLYKAALADTWDQIFLDLQSTWEQGVAGNFTISSQLSEAVQQALDYGAEHGIPINGSLTAITDRQELISLIGGFSGYEGYALNNNLLPACYTVFDAAVERWGSDQVTALCMQDYNAASHPNQNPLYVYFYSVGDVLTLTHEGNTYKYLRNDEPLMCLSVYPGGYSVNTLMAAEITVQNTFKTVNFGEYDGESVIPINPMTAAIRAEWAERSLKVITKDTPINSETGEFEPAEAVIFMPNGRIYPVYQTEDIIELVQDVSTSTTSAQVETGEEEEKKQDLNNKFNAKWGVAAGFAFSFLKNYFPFCIPRDIQALLQTFYAQRTAPHITFSLPYNIDVYYQDHTGTLIYNGFKWKEIDIDLSRFDSVAEVFRNCQIALFIVGLAVATRQIYLRG